MTEPAASGLLYGANVRANGIRQHYLRFGGAGPALVIVPGISTPAQPWDAFIKKAGVNIRFVPYSGDADGVASFLVRIPNS